MKIRRMKRYRYSREFKVRAVKLANYRCIEELETALKSVKIAKDFLKKLSSSI